MFKTSRQSNQTPLFSRDASTEQEHAHYWAVEPIWWSADGSDTTSSQMYNRSLLKVEIWLLLKEKPEASLMYIQYLRCRRQARLHLFKRDHLKAQMSCSIKSHSEQDWHRFVLQRQPSPSKSLQLSEHA
jgi:hypothetical protein